ncbi:MAG: hypothetical protein HYT49_02815 [Candidatus Wildermuthbacteria bacterium]|nr:hypothetical protein [Candidatus Wildermuthbacteria bacterium]
MENISFDPYELMALESVLTPSEVTANAEKMGALTVPTQDLCLKVGSALIEAREKGGEADLVLSEPECWILRERANIFMSIGQRHDVGLSIKLKLYHLLLDYAFEREAGEFETADHVERSAGEVRDALAQQHRKDDSS